MDTNEEKPAELKTGFTTGTCAAAAAKAAVFALVSRKTVGKVQVSLPIGKSVLIEIHENSFEEKKASASVIKFAGDDPDVTNGAEISASVSWNDSGTLKLLGGKGVGKVTKPGLPVAVGEPAINPVPRKMILHEVSEVLAENNLEGRGVDIIISVPEGEKIAEQTMNSRLGIIGGISILGTRGIVIPFSTAAYRSTLAVTIKASAENGLRHLIMTTGGRSERYARGLYPDLDPMAFHEAGEFIGFALKKCLSYGIHKVTICGMMGKFSKLAAGDLMLHSSRSSVNFEFLANLAAEAGAPEDVQQEIKGANTASHVGEIIIGHKLPAFFRVLNKYVLSVCRQKTAGQLDLEILLYTLDGTLLDRYEGK